MIPSTVGHWGDWKIMGRLLAFGLCGVLLLGAAPPQDDNQAKPPDNAEAQEPPPLSETVPKLVRSLTSGAHLKDVLDVLRKLKPRVEVEEHVITLLKDRDERIRTAALGTLGGLKAKTARQRVAMAFGDESPDVVIAASQALHRIGGKGADAEVQSLLAHKSVAVRCVAADLIRRQRSRKRISLLKKRYQASKLAEERACMLTALYKGGFKGALNRAVPLLVDSDTRRLAVRLLAYSKGAGLSVLGKALAGKPSEELVAGALEVSLHNGEAGMRWVATLIPSKVESVRRGSLELLLAKADKAYVRELLLKAAATTDADTRARVIDALITRKEKALLPLARKWIGDKSPAVRAASARVFAGMPVKTDGAMLLRRYQDERMVANEANLDVRIGLLKALGAIGNVDWVPVFVDACGQKGEAQAATDALVGVGNPAVRTLLLVVKVGDMQRIPFALEALARIGQGVGDAAEGLFRHPRELVRELGRDLMAASGDPKAVGALIKLFRSETLDDPVPVIEAIATFTTPEAFEALVDASTHPSEAVRIAAIQGMGNSHRRDKQLVGTIINVAETDKTPEVRIAAVRSLFQVSAPGLVALLTKMVAYEAPAVRMEVYNALGWAGHPDAVPALAARLRDAEGAEAKALNTALRRLTRRTDLKSERNFRSGHTANKKAVAPRVKARVGKFKAGDVTLNYRTVGRGQTVLVLGGHHSATAFSAALDALGASNRVVYFDGRGRAGNPMGKGISLTSEVTDIELLRRHLKAPRVSIVAHSAAGLIAVAYAGTYSKRVGKLMLVNTPARGLRHGVVSTAARKLKGANARDLSELDARHAWFAPVAWLGYRQFSLAPGYVGTPSLAPRVGQFPINPIAVQMLERAVAGYDLNRALAKIKKSTYLVTGARAPFTPAQHAALKRVSKTHRHAVMRIIKKVGHYPHLENPGAFLATARAILAPAR